MSKVAEFFKKWGFTMFLCIVAVAVLFALGCSVYTAVINPFVGITGIVGVLASLGVFAWLIYKEIKGEKAV